MPHAIASALTEAGACFTALVTPFRGTRLDEPALGALCDRQVARGAGAIVVCGSTGEAPALSAAEHARVVRIAAEAIAGRVPLIAGVGASTTQLAMELAVAAARRGAHALLCSAPPYVKPMQEGLFAHVRAVAHAADLPVMLYDVPGRAGVGFADATVARLFEAGLIAALKDAAGDLARPVRLRGLCGAGLLQMTGDDATVAAYLAMGGHGCVSVTANIAPAACAALHRAWTAGDQAGVARLRDRLHPLHEALFAESNPIPVKAALALLGLIDGEIRLPLTPASAATEARLAAVLADVMPVEDRACGRTHCRLAG